MDKDIFEEVRHIEEEAERVLAQARSDRDDILKNARAEAEACREQSRKNLEAESRRLTDEHERKLAEESDSLEEGFKARRTRLEETASRRTDKLADWVVSRFLEEDR